MAVNINNLSQSQQAAANNIIDLGKEMGVSEKLQETAILIASSESNLGQKLRNDTNPTVYGLFQFKQETFNLGWAKYTKLNPTDPQSNMSAANAYMDDAAQTKVMYMSLIQYDDRYDQGVIAKNWRIDGNLYGQTLTLLANQIDITTNFLGYAYLRHNTDPNQVITVVQRDFTQSNIGATQTLVAGRAQNSDVVAGSNLFSPTSQQIIDFEAGLFELDFNPDGTLIEVNNNFNDPFWEWSTNQLLSGAPALLDFSWLDDLSLDPIGAFYAVQDIATDHSPSIAYKTGVVINANGNTALTKQQLQAKDTNADGKLSGSELNNLNIWTDLNENGKAEGGEIKTVGNTGITEIKAADYQFYTAGNAKSMPEISQGSYDYYNYYRNYSIQQPYIIYNIPVYNNKYEAGAPYFPTFSFETYFKPSIDYPSFSDWSCLYTNSQLARYDTILIYLQDNSLTMSPNNLAMIGTNVDDVLVADLLTINFNESVQIFSRIITSTLSR